MLIEMSQSKSQNLPCGVIVSRILFVDDSEMVRTVFGRTLSEAGFNVDVVEDAEQALESLNNNPTYDLICTDLNMPGMNGLDMMQKIHEQLPSLPFVVLTTESHSTHKDRAKLHGARAWVAKTSSPDQLVKVIQKVLSPS